MCNDEFFLKYALSSTMYTINIIGNLCSHISEKLSQNAVPATVMGRPSRTEYSPTRDHSLI